MCTSAFETRQHDPETVAPGEFHEALKAKASDREIRYPAPEPGFSWSPHLDRNVQIATLGQTAVSICQIDLVFSAHDPLRSSAP